MPAVGRAPATPARAGAAAPFAPGRAVPPASARSAAAPAPAPKTGPTEGFPEGPEFFAKVEALAASIDRLDYFQVLTLERDTAPRAIKDAYYRESRLYHPDRFSQLPDAELRERINTVFKRITEAYVVLRDEGKRAKYLADLSGPERERKLRYTDASEAEQKAEAKRAAEEQIGTTPKGRESFKSALKEFDAGRFEAALRHLKMALMYEPANAIYKAKLKEAEAEHEKTRPKNDFRIR